MYPIKPIQSPVYNTNVEQDRAQQTVRQGEIPMINGMYAVKPMQPQVMSEQEFKQNAVKTIDRSLQQKALMSGNGESAFSYQNRRKSIQEQPNDSWFSNWFSPVTVNNEQITTGANGLPMSSFFPQAHASDVIPPQDAVVNNQSVQTAQPATTQPAITQQQTQQQTTEAAPPGTTYRDLIQEREGTNINEQGQHVVYKDSTGNLTVGRGHKLTPEELKNYKEGDVWGGTDVDKMFDNDLRAARNSAISMTKDFTNRDDRVVDAITNMNYQMGPGWKDKFPKAYDLMKNGKFNEAADELALNETGDGPSLWAKQTPKRLEDAQMALRAAGGPQTPTVGALTGVDTEASPEDISPPSGTENQAYNDIMEEINKKARSYNPDYDGFTPIMKDRMVETILEEDEDLYRRYREAQKVKEGGQVTSGDLPTPGKDSIPEADFSPEEAPPAQLPPEQEVVHVQGPQWMNEGKNDDVIKTEEKVLPADFDNPQNNMNRLDKEIMIQSMTKPQNKGMWDSMVDVISKDNQLKKALVMGGLTGIVASLGGANARQAMGFGLAGAVAQWKQNPDKAAAMKLTEQIGKYVNPEDQEALSEAMATNNWAEVRSIISKGYQDYALLDKGYSRDKDGNPVKITSATDQAELEKKNADIAKVQAETAKMRREEISSVKGKIIESRQDMNKLESADFLLRQGKGGMVPWYAGLYEKTAGKVLPEGVGKLADRISPDEYAAIQAELTRFISTLSAEEMKKFGSNPSMTEADNARMIAEKLLSGNEQVARESIMRLRNDIVQKMQVSYGYEMNTKTGKLTPPAMDSTLGLKDNQWYPSYDMGWVHRQYGS